MARFFRAYRPAVAVACGILAPGGTLLPPGGAAAAVVEDELIEWLEQERQARHIPAVGYAFVKDGRVVRDGGLGLARIDEQRAATARTLFRVGSVSKPLTATALLQLIGESELELDSDIRPLLQDLPFQPALDQALTPHQLLTHTCGLNERLFGQHARDRRAFVDLGRYLEEHLPPRFAEPGTVIAYNDHCTSLAGLVVERQSGLPFAEYLRRQVFPLFNMDDADFDQFVDPGKAPGGMANSYLRVDGDFAAYERDYVMTAPAAGLYATPRDMGRYLAGLLAADDPLLSRQKAVQVRNHERLDGRSYGFATMRSRGVGVFYKDGQAMGFSARLVMVPEIAGGFFIVQNRSIFGRMGSINEAGRLARDFTSEYLERVLPAVDAGAAPAPPVHRGSDVSPYTGSFRNVVAARHTFEKVIGMMDDIIVEDDGPGAIRLGSQRYVDIGDGVFQRDDGSPNYLAFERPGTSDAAFLFIGGGAYERVPAWSNSTWAPRLVGAGLGLAVLLAIAAIVGERLGSIPASLSRKIVVSSALKISGIAGIAATFALTDLQQFFFGAPPVLTLLLGLPLLALALDGWLLATAIRTHRRAGSRARLLAAAHLAVAAGLLLWLHDWNLLGWRYG